MIWSLRAISECRVILFLTAAAAVVFVALLLLSADGDGKDATVLSCQAYLHPIFCLIWSLKNSEQQEMNTDLR